MSVVALNLQKFDLVLLKIENADSAILSSTFSGMGAGVFFTGDHIQSIAMTHDRRRVYKTLQATASDCCLASNSLFPYLFCCFFSKICAFRFSS